MNVRLLFDRILVAPILEDLTKPLPLIITPDMAKEKPTRAIVRAVGPGALLETPLGWKDRPMQVQPGDVIAYGKYSGQELEIDGEKLLIMREEDALYIETPVPA